MFLSPNGQVATTLLGLSVPTGSASAHILAFIGGPCSEGSGKVVGRELSEEIRSHKVSSQVTLSPIAWFSCLGLEALPHVCCLTQGVFVLAGVFCFSALHA